MEKKFSFSQTLLLSLLFLGIFVAGVVSFWFYQNKLNQNPPLTPTPQVLPLSPVQELQPTVEPTATSAPIPTTKSDSEGIRQAMAKKYSKSVGDVDMSISKIDATHAWGSVKFAGEMGGGWFLAYKNPEGWLIVADGNGTISCETIAPYNFTSDMVPECVDKNGVLINR